MYSSLLIVTEKRKKGKRKQEKTKKRMRKESREREKRKSVSLCKSVPWQERKMFLQSNEALLLFFSPWGKCPWLFYILPHILICLLSSYQGLGKMWEDKAVVSTDFPLSQCFSNSISKYSESIQSYYFKVFNIQK